MVVKCVVKSYKRYFELIMNGFLNLQVLNVIRREIKREIEREKVQMKPPNE